MEALNKKCKNNQQPAAGTEYGELQKCRRRIMLLWPVRCGHMAATSFFGVFFYS
jgi:hypothetical protein